MTVVPGRRSRPGTTEARRIRLIPERWALSASAHRTSQFDVKIATVRPGTVKVPS